MQLRKISDNFFEKSAEYYDLLYSDKDYEKECDFVEEIFKRYSKNPIKSILDVGCGTGGHAIPLAKRGYGVVGFDLSELMIRKAKEKARNLANLELHVKDMRDFQFDSKFDACVCMFAVIGYLTKNQDIQKTLTNIKRHLKDGSLFIFDFWNGLAVLRILPSVRVKIVEDKGKKVTRTAEPELDAFNHVCKINYRLAITEDNIFVDEIKETHTVRFYFPQEITHYLEDAGFEVLKICPFLDLNGSVNEGVWNVAAISRAVEGKNDTRM